MDLLVGTIYPPIELRIEARLLSTLWFIWSKHYSGMCTRPLRRDRGLRCRDPRCETEASKSKVRPVEQQFRENITFSYKMLKKCHLSEWQISCVAILANITQWHKPFLMWQLGKFLKQTISSNRPLCSRPFSQDRNWGLRCRDETRHWKVLRQPWDRGFDTEAT